MVNLQVLNKPKYVLESLKVGTFCFDYSCAHSWLLLNQQHEVIITEILPTVAACLSFSCFDIQRFSLNVNQAVSSYMTLIKLLHTLLHYYVPS